MHANLLLALATLELFSMYHKNSFTSHSVIFWLNMQHLSIPQGQNIIFLPGYIFHTKQK